MKRDDRTRVILLTQTYKITGDIALMAGARLTDYILEAKDFLAIVDAEVTDHSGRAVLTAPFLSVNRHCVEVIVPA